MAKKQNTEDKSKNTSLSKNQVHLWLVCALTLVVFLPTFYNGFINFDDPQYILENTVIQSFNSINLKQIFISPFVGNYQPITMLTYMVDHALFGLNPKIYHFTNLIFHLLNVIVLYFIFLRVSHNNTISLIITALFGIHPLHVESVAWIAARKDVVYAFFFFLSILFYLKYIQQQKKQFYTFSILLFILSVLSKAQAVVLPVALLLFDYILNRKLNKKTIFEKLPFFAVSIVFGVLAFVIQRNAGAVQTFSYFPLYQRILFACYGLANYLYKIILPVDLSIFYPYPETNDKINTSWVYYSPVILAVIGYFIYRYGRNSKAVVFGVLFFLLTIFLVLQLIPVGDAVLADRYTYIPLLGLFFTAAHYYTNLLERKKNLKRILTIAGYSYMLVLAILSFNRTRQWKDSISIYSASVDKYPAAIIYNNRGAAYVDNNMPEKAIGDFKNVLKLKPHYPNGLKNRAVTYGKLKQYDKAIEDYTAALKLYPADDNLYFLRGNSYKEMNRFNEAIIDYNKTIELNPKNIEAYYSRGECYGRNGKLQEAISDYNMVISMKPEYSQAYGNRGIAYSLAGKTDLALADFNKAIELDPQSWNSYFNRSVALKNIGKYNDALKDALIAKQNGHSVDESYIKELKALSSSQN